LQQALVKMFQELFTLLAVVAVDLTEKLLRLAVWVVVDLETYLALVVMLLPLLAVAVVVPEAAHQMSAATAAQAWLSYVMRNRR
jgi:hypothetical protein